MAVPEDELIRLITDLKERLLRQLRGLEGGLAREIREGFAQLNARFDAQEARLNGIDGQSSDWPLP